MIIPKNISFLLWANQLNIDYPKDTIPIVTKKEDWKDWGARLKDSSSFVNIPVPLNEKSWDEWAMKVYRSMN